MVVGILTSRKVFGTSLRSDLNSPQFIRYKQRKTFDSLKTSHPDSLLQLRDIYNLTAELEVLFNHGLAPIQGLLTSLDGGQRWQYDYLYDEHNRLVNMLFSITTASNYCDYSLPP
jgi:hypothetical protein